MSDEMNFAGRQNRFFAAFDAPGSVSAVLSERAARVEIIATTELEHCAAALEEKVAEMEQGRKTPSVTSHEWLDKVFGIFADCPEFEEMVKAGQEWRKTEVISADS